MNANAWIALAAAIVSVGASILSFVSSKRSQAIAKGQAEVAMGQAESAIRANIRITRQSVRDLSVRIGEVVSGKRPNQLTAEENRRLEPLTLAFREACEDNLNAYEDACGKYLDKKIDVERFKKSYIEEIRGVCQQKNPPIADFMLPETTSKFQAIWKVYREWHIHEK